MKRKIIDTLLFMTALVLCVLLTLYMAGGNYSSPATIYNFLFLGAMAVLYLISLCGGIFRMTEISEYFRDVSAVIDTQPERENVGLEDCLQEISAYGPLRKNLKRFAQDLKRSKSGILDIEDYINEDETDTLIHKRMLDIVPDILTTLGILGTFIGLVLGLRSFQPSNYEVMTASVTSLVEGIKVAFLTSIYGLILSLINSYSMRTGYSAMTDELQSFLILFHNKLVPSAEMEAQNRLINIQTEQTELIHSLTEEFSDQVAHGFAANLAPTLDRINTQLGSMMTTISNNQQMFLKEIVDSFVKEMKESFHTEFTRFGESVQAANDMVTNSISESEDIYRRLSADLRSIFTEDEVIMHAAVAEFSDMEREFGRKVDGVMEQYDRIIEKIRNTQEASLDNLAKSEGESARFWVAVNQAMNNYLESASAAYGRFESAQQASDKVLKAITATYQKNEKLLEESRKQTEELLKVEKEMNESLAEIRRVFYQMEIAGSSGNTMYLYPGVSRQSREQEQRMIKQMETIVSKSEKRQDKKLEEILGGIDDLNDKAGRKSRWFGW